ncbi:MAG: DNA mismatch endonuclease Vsr [Parvibaculum sp.]|uniref:very short patch repair endonuclease n=1 Tax=Parvibaculum sp. TaxID=2024848 RepID=UPI0032632DB4
MVDRLTPKRRSWLMSRVRGRDTTPEMAVRRVAHALGYRFRLHRRDLPGSPDLVFTRFRAVVFVHGCFWHHHRNCPKATIPKTRTDFWREKFRVNRQRDKRVLRKLAQLGWRPLVVWECETKDREALASRLVTHLEERNV